MKYNKIPLVFLTVLCMGTRTMCFTISHSSQGAINIIMCVQAYFLKMSWDSYIDSLIAQTEDVAGAVHCDKACIIGLDNGDSWTTQAHPNALKLQTQEGQAIARCFRTKDYTFFKTTGVYVEGTYYIFIRQDDNVVYARTGGEAVTLQATKTAVIIARCPVGSQQGFTNKGVYAIAQYLESQNM